MSDNDTISEAVLSSKMVRRTEIFRLLAVGYTAPQAAHEYNKAHPDDKDVTADWINQTKFKHKDEFGEVKKTEIDRLRGEVGTIGHGLIKWLIGATGNLKVPEDPSVREISDGLKMLTALYDLNKKIAADTSPDKLIDTAEAKEIDDTMKNLIKEKDAGKK